MHFESKKRAWLNLLPKNMGKISQRTVGFVFAIMITASLSAIISGCASQKAGLSAPTLPARHWLEESPGVPIENKSKLQAAVPNLYDSGKTFTFEDCVFLSIQQSPALVNSAVDIEIKKLDLTSAVWRYLPEPRMRIGISNNLTVYNKNRRDVPANYGKSEFDVEIRATFPNPVETYFNHQARKVLHNLAITTHRKAIDGVITEIADIYQRLEAQRKTLEIQQSLVPLTKKVTAYWRKLEAVDGSQGVALNLSIQREREAELKLERTRIENTMLRTKLKTLAGVDTLHKLNISTKNVDDMFKGFQASSLSWEDRWLITEDEFLLRAQVKLKDFNILVAWAEYIPSISFALNQSPPTGQYQPVDGTDDTFFHLFIDFPLIDWGRRYRGVQTARMEKAKAFQDQRRARTKYSNDWLEAKQQVQLAETSVKIAKTSLDIASMKAKEAQINFNAGVIAYPELAGAYEALSEAKIAHVDAELKHKLARLMWMKVAGFLKERYIGKPARELF